MESATSGWGGAEPSTMKGMLRVVQERYVGDMKLNDSVSIMALMNRSKPLWTPTISRPLWATV